MIVATALETVASQKTARARALGLLAADEGSTKVFMGKEVIMASIQLAKAPSEFVSFSIQIEAPGDSLFICEKSYEAEDGVSVDPDSIRWTLNTLQPYDADWKETAEREMQASQDKQRREGEAYRAEEEARTREYNEANPYSKMPFLGKDWFGGWDKEYSDPEYSGYYIEHMFKDRYRRSTERRLRRMIEAAVELHDTSLVDTILQLMAKEEAAPDGAGITGRLREEKSFVGEWSWERAPILGVFALDPSVRPMIREEHNPDDSAKRMIRDTSGTLIGSSTWNELEQRWDYVDAAGHVRGTGRVNSAAKRYDYCDASGRLMGWARFSPKNYHWLYYDAEGNLVDITSWFF